MGLFDGFYLNWFGKFLLADMGAKILLKATEQKWANFNDDEIRELIRAMIEESPVVQDYLGRGHDIGDVIRWFNVVDMSSKEFEKKFKIKWTLKKRV